MIKNYNFYSIKYKSKTPYTIIIKVKASIDNSNTDLYMEYNGPDLIVTSGYLHNLDEIRKVFNKIFGYGPFDMKKFPKSIFIKVDSEGKIKTEYSIS